MKNVKYKILPFKFIQAVDKVVHLFIKIRQRMDEHKEYINVDNIDLIIKQ